MTKEKDDNIEFIIEPDNALRPFTDEMLDSENADRKEARTLRERIKESYGLGWYVLATGAIAVTAAGLRHFKDEHPDQVDEDD